MLSLFDGKVCTRCGEWKSLDDYHRHPSTRDRRQSRCKPCAGKAVTEWNRRNPERVAQHARRVYAERDVEQWRARAQAYYLANKERYQQNRIRWEAEHPEQRQAVRRRWQVENPSRVKAYHYAWLERKAENGGSFSADEWIALCERYGFHCLACRRRLPLAADHIVPLSAGGPNSIENIQPLCKSCNSKKGRQTIDYRPAWDVEDTG